MAALVVQKYGGTSVGTLDHLRNVAGHVAATVRQGHQVVVTISAMGEQTDDLLAMAQALSPKPPRRELDMLLTAGERISAALLAIALQERAIDSLSLTGSQVGILTDDTHGNARITTILGDRVRSNLAQGRVVIVAGFQGVTAQTKEITTLGRGGSDLSAIALAAALGATHCQLYKDVPGVYTSDPRAVPSARLLPQLSWGAMSALAWAGAAVLHPRGAHLAAKYQIPFEIRSSLALEQAGTRIEGRTSVERPQTFALAHKCGQVLATYRVTAAGAASLLAQVLAWLWQHGEAPQVNHQTSESSESVHLTLVVAATVLVDLELLLNDLTRPSGGRWERLLQQPGLATVAMIGQGYKQSPETAAMVCQLMGPELLLLDVTDQQMTVGLREDSLGLYLPKLHALLIEQPALQP